MPGFYKSTMPGFYNNSNEFATTSTTSNLVDTSSSLATSSPIVKPIATILNYTYPESSKDVKSKISTNDEFLAGN